MKTKILLISTLIAGGLLFTSCQKDNSLIEETSFEQLSAEQDVPDSPKSGTWGSSLGDPGSIDQDRISNFPDPFTRYTTIQYNLKKSSFVRLVVYANDFEQVAILVNGYKKAGKHLAKFNASGMPVGEYIAELKTNEGVFKEEMTKIPLWHADDSTPVKER